MSTAMTHSLTPFETCRNDPNLRRFSGKWKKTNMGRIGSIYGGLSGKRKVHFGAGTARYVTFLGVLENVILDVRHTERVHVDPGESQNAVMEGDLLFNASSETPGDLAIGAVMGEQLDNLYLNSFCFGFRVHNKSEHIPLFLAYFFRGAVGRRIMNALAQGATRYNMSKSQFLALELSIPPCDEQRAIAEVLSDVDGLINSLEALLVKKRAIKQGVTQQLLTGKTRLPGFSGTWETKRLANIGSCLRGVSYNPMTDLSSYDQASTVRLLRANNVQDAAVTLTDVQYVAARKVSEFQIMQPDDILVCMANGSKELVGKAGLFRVRDGYTYTFGAFMGCFRVEPAIAEPSFAFHLFQTHEFRNFINLILAGSSINNLKPSDIESAEFQVPAREEQRAIVSVLSDMDAEIAALEERRDKTLAIKQGMMQLLFTGRVRLPESPIGTDSPEAAD